MKVTYYKPHELGWRSTSTRARTLVIEGKNRPVHFDTLTQAKKHVKALRNTQTDAMQGGGYLTELIDGQN